MADEKKQAVDNEQETLKPEKHDELSEKDLGNASGGAFEKWITFHKI